MGIYGLVWSLAFVCGPSLGLLLFSASPLALWLACGILGLLAAGIVLADPQERASVSGLTEVAVRTRQPILISSPLVVEKQGGATSAQAQPAGMRQET